MSGLMKSRTISISIDCPSAHVYCFVSEPLNLPKWAKGLCTSVLRSAHGWVIESERGRMGFRFSDANEFGVLDHFVSPVEGLEFLVPMRVVPNGAGSEVLFTLFQTPEMTDEKFHEDAALVQRDIETLKAVLEHRAPGPLDHRSK